MLAMKAVRLQLGELLAADDTILAPAADNNEVVLLKEPVALDEELTIDEIEPADFDGSAPIDAGLGTQQCGIDPVTGEQVITIKEPAGGFRWETTDDTNLPQTIYGYAFTTKDAADLLGVHMFDTPISLTEAGQEINAGVVSMRVVPEPLF